MLINLDVEDKISLVMLGHAAGASFAMLTTKGLANHAMQAEILVIELPQCQELFDDSFLLTSATQFGDIAGVFNHTVKVEVCTKAVCNCK